MQYGGTLQQLHRVWLRIGLALLQHALGYSLQAGFTTSENMSLKWPGTCAEQLRKSLKYSLWMHSTTHWTPRCHRVSRHVLVGGSIGGCVEGLPHAAA
jgi:hypothetical protein